MRIPNQIQQRLNEEGGTAAIAYFLEASMSRVLDSSSGERMAMMQAALPLMSEPVSEFGILNIDSDLVKRFNEFCEVRSLREDILLTGALMFELEMAEFNEGSDTNNFCLPPKDD
jgi:NDP-sugar pyrophosphorylase family protein